MDINDYQNFMKDPKKFLDDETNVKQVRFHHSLNGAIPNSISQTVNNDPQLVPLHYQYSSARIIPVTLQKDDTGMTQNSAVWISKREPSNGSFQKDRAYYLQWEADHAYAIELGGDAQLFFTAELTGCGILIFTMPDKLLVVHHNVQVTDGPTQTAFQKMFESTNDYRARETEHVKTVRENALHRMAMAILDSKPEINGGTQMSVGDYGGTARVFGVRRGKAWRIYVNKPNGNTFVTEKIFG